MHRVTEYAGNPNDLQFAIDQIHKYNPGTAFLKKTKIEGKEVYCVMRDYTPPKKELA